MNYLNSLRTLVLLKKAPFGVILSHLLTLMVVLVGITLPLLSHAQNTYGTLPDFSFKDSENKSFRKKDLNGKAWLAHTFFTSCQSVCPTIIADIKSLILTLQEQKRPGVMSITVDPLTDSTEVLKQYRDKRGLNNLDWKLITGKQDAITAFIEKGLLLASPGNIPDAHSPRIVLIDKNSKIVGFYRSNEPLDMMRLKEDLVNLTTHLKVSNYRAARGVNMK